MDTAPTTQRSPTTCMGCAELRHQLALADQLAVAAKALLVVIKQCDTSDRREWLVADLARPLAIYSEARVEFGSKGVAI